MNQASPGRRDWDALDAEERQVLVDAWRWCDDPGWKKSLEGVLPGVPLRRRLARALLGVVYVAGGTGLILAAMASVKAGSGLGFWSALAGIAAITRARTWLDHRLAAPAAHPPGGPPDPAAVARLPRNLEGVTWTALASRLAAAVELGPPSALAAMLKTGSWEYRLLAFEALRRLPLAVRRANLADQTGIGRDMARGRWHRVLLRRLLPAGPPPPAGLDPVELAVCARCLSRWHDRWEWPGLGLSENLHPTPRPPRCRRCGEEGPVVQGDVARIVAVVDLAAGGDELVGRILRVDALARGEPFDLDAVEIGLVGDAEVESLCVKIANDPDPMQRRRTARAPVTVHPATRLSANTLEMLRRTFGSVDHGARSQRQAGEGADEP